MNNRDKITAVAVVGMALVIAVAVGWTMASSANTSTLKPAQIEAQTGGEPAIQVFASFEGNQLDEGDTAKLEATVISKNKTPVENVSVTFMSLGYGGEFNPEATVKTNSEGVATVEFLMQIPNSAFDKNTMPPAMSLSMAATAEVNGTTAQTIQNFPARPECEECHTKGEHE